MSSSHITQQTNKIIEDVTLKSSSKLYKHQTEEVSEGVVTQTWESFGKISLTQAATWHSR